MSKDTKGESNRVNNNDRKLLEINGLEVRLKRDTSCWHLYVAMNDKHGNTKLIGYYCAIEQVYEATMKWAIQEGYRMADKDKDAFDAMQEAVQGVRYMKEKIKEAIYG